MYADDSKIIGLIKSKADAVTLQNDIDEVVRWSKIWLMELNVAKCKVMHVGRLINKLTQDYTMLDQLGNRKTLESTNNESDLEIIVSHDLRVKYQVEAASARANCVLGSLKKAFRSRGLSL